MKKERNNIAFGILALVGSIVCLIIAQRIGSLYFVMFAASFFFFGFIGLCFPKLFKWFETDRPDIDRYEKSRRKKPKAKKR